MNGQARELCASTKKQVLSVPELTDFVELSRRIGENELSAILVCRTYVKAQLGYTLR